jgi:hypothetical protein
METENSLSSSVWGIRYIYGVVQNSGFKGNNYDPIYGCDTLVELVYNLPQDGKIGIKVNPANNEYHWINIDRSIISIRFIMQNYISF